MDNVHTPTVGSGATTNGTVQNGGQERASLTELMAKKDSIESELSALGSVLDSHGVNMNTGLTTFDGFPRADIDVAQIRTTRARIIRLRNDYKTVMAMIEDGLHTHHEQLQERSSSTASTSRPAAASGSSQVSDSNQAVEVSFAKVNSIASGSPAETAGLKVGDRVTVFGAANWMNHEKLSKVAQVVSENEGRQVLVKVLRAESAEPISMHLIPRRDWGGRGMLGCHLLPI
ncbi:26S proteasome non-ATPase regulatory subunit 9 [Viridothelium virens]|uniref:Probable 26S proteasome regulatory subunit p27 n=1 Tax=Viridothelium virens TaxID=1048519 RepID=A0A6A6H8C8_VIRVR|nr:26S proteasome non-ATPase regulatory subunit 9 [Viridothelium virens]